MTTLPTNPSPSTTKPPYTPLFFPEPLPLLPPLTPLSPPPPPLSLMLMSHHQGKQHTKPFSPVNMNKMAKKYTTDTTPVYDSPTASPAEASARSPGLTVSNSPYSLRNCNFSTISISTKKVKREKRQMMINLLSTIPLPPKLFPLFIQRITPNPLAL